MKKREEKYVRSVLAWPERPTENFSYWTWACRCVSTAGTNGLPQVNTASLGYYWRGRIWASLWLGNLFSCPQRSLTLPRAWAPTVPHKQICSDLCQQGHPCCDLGKLSAFISRLLWHSTNNIVNRSCSIFPWTACPPGCRDCSQADSQHTEGRFKQGLWDKPLLSIKCHRIFNAHAEQAAVTQRTFSTLKLHGNYLPLKLCLAYRDSNI